MKNDLKTIKIFIGISIFLLFTTSCTDRDRKKQDFDHPAILHYNFNKDIDYRMIEPKQINPESIEIDSLFVQVAYQLQSNRLLVIGKSLNEQPNGLKLLLIDPGNNYKLIYRSRGMMESWILHPVFFEAEEPNYPLVILAAFGTSESWGQQVFLMRGDTINEIGFMDVTGKELADTAFFEDGYHLTDIGPFTKIKTKKERLNFYFTVDSVFYYGEYKNRYDPTFAGDKLAYYFDGDSLIIKVND